MTKDKMITKLEKEINGWQMIVAFPQYHVPSEVEKAREIVKLISSILEDVKLLK